MWFNPFLLEVTIIKILKNLVFRASVADLVFTLVLYNSSPGFPGLNNLLSKLVRCDVKYM